METINMQQDQIFLEREGNGWFDRNSQAIDQKNVEFDLPTHIIDLIANKSGLCNIVELGCSNGWRLQRLQEKLPDIQFTGIDASLAAIEDGRTKYPQVELHQGILADIPLQQQYDVVIVYFVFHWVDRSSLARSIAEVDRLVKDGGMLIIGDFDPDFAQRRPYHHLPDDNIFTYKQNYVAIFESLGIYKESIKFTGDHGVQQQFSIENCKSGSRFSCSALHKSLTDYYHQF
jgi:SAM-dependent methyltransferase